MGCQSVHTSDKTTVSLPLRQIINKRSVMLISLWIILSFADIVYWCCTLFRTNHSIEFHFGIVCWSARCLYTWAVKHGQNVMSLGFMRSVKCDTSMHQAIRHSLSTFLFGSSLDRQTVVNLQCNLNCEHSKQPNHDKWGQYTGLKWHHVWTAKRKKNLILHTFWKDRNFHKI